MIYDGHLTNLFKKLRLAVPYYTQIKNQLTAMGCIEMMRRGGGNATSRWVLWKEPELEAWKAIIPSRPRRGNKTTILEQQIKDLTARTEKLEMVVSKLVAAVLALQGARDADVDALSKRAA
jgi:hypothetical protein